MLLRGGVVLALALAAFWTARLAWADHLSRSLRVADRRRALSLAPLDAAIATRLAEALEDAGADPLPALETAVALDPQNPDWRMALGQRAELAGRLGLAEASLQAAFRLSRLYQPKYLLAGYYFRRGNADLCIRWSLAALAIGSPDGTPVLNLMARLLDPSAMAAQGVGQSLAVTRRFLVFLATRGSPAAAWPLALRLAREDPSGDLPTVLWYAGQLLAEGRAPEAVALWNLLCERHLLPYGTLDPAAGRSLTNADFRHLPMGMGFDWRTETVAGLRATRFDGGLQAVFSGAQPDDCLLVWQYVPLVPGSVYRLRAETQAEDSDSAAGLVWRLFYSLNGSSWDLLDGDLTRGFRAPAAVARLALMYRRAPGTRRLAGGFSVRAVRLDRQP